MNMKNVVWGGYNLLKKTIKVLKLPTLYYYIMKPFSHKKLFVEDLTKEKGILQSFSSRPLGTSITKNNLITPFTYDLQIIVPAYNVEEYLRECMDSILSQKTKYSYQVILIDDGSTDKTNEIADEYAKYENVVIIHQENCGFSGARNAGLNEIKGNYLMFVDSDDKLPAGSIQTLMSVAMEKEADIVEGGFYTLYEDKLSIYYQHRKFEKVEAEGGLKGFPCGKVFKSSLFGELHFPEGFWFEDSINSFLIWPQVEKAYLITEMVYVYRQRATSISHVAGENTKCIDTYWITEQLMKERESLCLTKDVKYLEKFLRQVVLNMKRIRKMPLKIQKIVFILSSDLMKKYISGIECPSQYKELYTALKNFDFGIYQLYCKTKSL